MMGYVVLVAVAVVVLIGIQRYRHGHSAKFYYPRSMKRMDEAEQIMEQLEAKSTQGRLTQSDLIRAEKKMRSNAARQRKEALPTSSLMEHRVEYARMYDLYALRLHDLAYNNGRGLETIDAYINESTRQTLDRAKQQIADHNRFLAEIGLPPTTLEDWSRDANR